MIELNDLIGAWRLHDYVLVAADGGRRRPFRDDSNGLIFYTANGFMSVATVQIDSETGEAPFLSYHGPFDLYEDRIVHHIEMSTDPGLVGRDNVSLETSAISSSVNTDDRCKKPASVRKWAISFGSSSS